METLRQSAPDPSAPSWRAAKWWARALLAAAAVSLFVGPAFEADALRLAPHFFVAGLVALPAALFAGATARRPDRAVPRSLVRYARFSAAVLVVVGLPVLVGEGPGLAVRILGGALVAGGAGVLVWSWVRPGGHGGDRRDTSGGEDAGEGSVGIELPFMVACGAGVLLVAVHTVQAFPPPEAARAAMERDLRSVREAQAAYASGEGRSSYAADTAVLRRRFGLQTSLDVVGPKIRLTADGYTAELGHREMDIRCVMYVGSTPIRPATEPGEPACSVPEEDAGPDPLLFTLAATLAHGLAVGLVVALLL